MPEQVMITGSGVAACCCAALLSQAGYRVFVNPGKRGESRALMLSQQTQILLRDIFKSDSLLKDAVTINQRIVAWGPRQEPVMLPHSGMVISEAVLLHRLWSLIGFQQDGCDQPNHWNVHCSKSSLPSHSQHEFGSRVAFTNRVEMAKAAALHSCWIEATESGWLFLIPAAEATGSLISVGADAEVLLSQSRVVAQQIGRVGEQGGSFAAYPRIAMPLYGSSWIACGSAAVAFDPIAGEGAGQALRQGILAAAVVRAAGNGSAVSELLDHYSNRVLGGFLRHLQHSAGFYQAMPGGWWRAEFASLQEGLKWAQREIASRPSENCFRLNGFELEKLAEVSH